jgi:hypothetical protein
LDLLLALLDAAAIHRAGTVLLVLLRLLSWLLR